MTETIKSHLVHKMIPQLQVIVGEPTSKEEYQQIKQCVDSIRHKQRNQGFLLLNFN